MTTITVFKGDGIGPEITDAVIKVLNAAGADLEYEFFNVGAKVYEETKINTTIAKPGLNLELKLYPF